MHGKTIHTRMKSHHHKLSSSSRSSPKINVSCLTSKVTRDHLMEIFSGFGNILSVEMIPCTSSEKSSHSASLQSAYIDYETKSEAAKAVKSMNGGMIDLHEVMVELVPRKAAHENHKTTSRKPKK